MQLSEIVPGFGVGSEWNREDLAERLIDLWLHDSEVATELASLSWVKDGDITGYDNPLLMALIDIAFADIQLGRQAAGLSWMTGSVGEEEWFWLTSLGAIASKGLELARKVADFPWFADGVTTEEFIALSDLDSMASVDLALAWTFVDLPWFVDGVTGDKWGILHELDYIASMEPELARWLPGFPLRDELVDMMVLGFYVLVVGNHLEPISEITSLRWVQDGLDQEEMTDLVALLSDARHRALGR